MDLQNSCFSGNAIGGPLFALDETTEVRTVANNAVDPLTASGCTLMQNGSSCIEPDCELCPLHQVLSTVSSNETCVVAVLPKESSSSNVPLEFCSALFVSFLALATR